MASVDLTFDVAVDVDSRRSRPQTFGTPPEAEGDTCGTLFFGETADADGTVVFEPIPGTPGRNADDSFQLAMGDDVASDGTSPLSGGAVPLSPDMSAGEAISEINKNLKQADDRITIVQNGVNAIDGEITAIQAEIAAIQTGGAGGSNDGFQVLLGPVATEGDGSWTPGAVPLDDTVPVSEAVDRLNEVLGKLVPAAPPAFPNGLLTISNTAGSSPRLCSGVTDNTTGGDPYSPGDAVTRVTAGASTFTFNDVGPGDAGTIEVFTNGALSDSHALNGTTDNGAYGALVIGDQKDFPVTTPGFWKSIDISISGESAPVGVNKLKIVHTAAGASNEAFFVRDAMTSVPAISAGAVIEVAPGTLAFSSSVPHYNLNAQIQANLSVANLAGETYYGGSDPLVISGTNAIFQSRTVTYAGQGVTTPIARQTTAPVAITGQTFTIDGNNVHAAGQVQGTAKNVNGPSAATLLSTKTILVKRGSAGARIDEGSIVVTGLGGGVNGFRVGLPTGDRPAGGAAAWDSTAVLPAYEATVVGGVLKHDQTNYSTGFLPVGPDLSAGRLGAQYVTFTFRRPALSVFKINITGNYDGAWVRLLGVTDNPAIAPNALNGWMDAMKSYDGAGVPGKAGDTAAGCGFGIPMNGANGAFAITFGTQSSTNATNNEIQVRIKLSPGEQITALTFSN